MRSVLRLETAMKRALEIKAGNAPALLALGEVFWRQKTLRRS